MSDQSFHEIQLSGKQLVFLFMCAVVLTVVVFLFGVSVGREVRSPSVQAASASPSSAPTDTVVPAETPPPTQTAPNELSYAQALQGREGEDPSKVAPPAPVSEAPPAAAPAPKSEAAAATPQKSEPAPPHKLEPASSRKSEPPAPPATKKPDTATPSPPAAASPGPPPKSAPAQKPVAPPAPAVGGFYVQVEAFSSNDVAAREVAKLRGKGYPALVFTESESSPSPRFKVRVGPYAARLEADQMRKKLTKEGYTPLIKR